MDKSEDLASLSRLFDVDEVSAVLWGDALLIKWFIGQCSLTGSKATQEGWHGGGLVQDTIQQASKTLKGQALPSGLGLGHALCVNS